MTAAGQRWWTYQATKTKGSTIIGECSERVLISTLLYLVVHERWSLSTIDNSEIRITKDNASGSEYDTVAYTFWPK